MLEILNIILKILTIFKMLIEIISFFENE